METATAGAAFFAGQTITTLAGSDIADQIGPRPAGALGFLLVTIGGLRAGLLASSVPSMLGWRSLRVLGSGFAFAARASGDRPPSAATSGPLGATR